jgi:alkylated DNA repair dioxygenase AlkB
MSTQAALFAAEDVPSGLRYEPGFVSVEEESELVALVQKIELQPFQFGMYEGKRRVAWFGWQYDYSDRKLKKADDIPGWLGRYVERVEAFDALPPGAIRQVLITEYEAGAGIGWHRDKPHFDRIYGLSLQSACRFRFRRRDGSKWQRYTLEAEPRSLYRMEAQSRHEWEHSIPPVETLRYSITFRSMR